MQLMLRLKIYECVTRRCYNQLIRRYGSHIVHEMIKIVNETAKIYSTGFMLSQALFRANIYNYL